MSHTYYCGSDGIGTLCDSIQQPVHDGKYTIFQSLWTRPIRDNVRLRDTLYIAALSLAFAHHSGYKVNMHTDLRGAELLKHFGYDMLYITLENIPSNVPSELFAAGKFFAMKKEGIGKVHIDVDVFIKKAGLLDIFYEDKRIDLICQQDENYDRVCQHEDKIRPMYIMGFPAATRPNWRGSINVGVIGFNNKQLADTYVNNYFEALQIYTAEKFEAYSREDNGACLLLDFILEQVTLSHLSVGHNVRTLVPTDNPLFVANCIGYQHLQGDGKWKPARQKEIIDFLKLHFPDTYAAVNDAVNTLQIG